ncbi:MAG: hypothetical protein AB7O59_06530 [Pirellulales bacterium]
MKITLHVTAEAAHELLPMLLSLVEDGAAVDIDADESDNPPALRVVG